MASDPDDDPSPLTRYFQSRPGFAAIGSGLLLAAWCVVLDVPFVVSVAVGMALGVLQWIVWRPNGPGRRWRQAMLRRFPKKER